MVIRGLFRALDHGSVYEDGDLWQARMESTRLAPYHPDITWLMLSPGHNAHGITPILVRLFADFSVVRVTSLRQPPDAYDSWRLNRRPPAIGDVGVVVHIVRSLSGEITYTVECINLDGTIEWLDDFVESELTADAD